MGKATSFVLIVFVFFYFVLLALDIGLNFLSIIPFIGSAFESVSEIIIETLSAIMFLVTSYFAIKWGVER